MATSANVQKNVAEIAAPVTLAYEHPWAVRFAHWVNAVAVLVLIGSGLQIFRAFPSFGPKIPQKRLHRRSQAIHARRMAGRRACSGTSPSCGSSSAAGCCMSIYQIATGHWRQVLFLPRDIKGVWPMARHYFLFGPKPWLTPPTTRCRSWPTLPPFFFGVLSTLTGMVLYKPAQFWWLAWLMGGFHLRTHLALPRHVRISGVSSPATSSWSLLHGWNNFYSMVTGWKRDPEYLE